MPIRLHHNLDPGKFEWLWAKYVRGINDTKHCTASLRGDYSTVLSGHNEQLLATPVITLDEEAEDRYRSIYICGVAKRGYRKKQNYPHNLHAAIAPKPGAHDRFEFENWQLEVENGLFLPIPAIEELPARYASLPPEFTTCRIFRWAVCTPLEYRGVVESGAGRRPRASKG